MKFELNTKDDDIGIIELLNSSFRTPISEEEWDWYSYGNPHGVNQSYLLRENKKIVGCYCVNDMRVLQNASPLKIGYANHLAVAPDFRGAFTFLNFSKNVFEREKERGTQFLIGPPNKISYQSHKSLAGWKDFGTLQILVKQKPVREMHHCQEIAEFNQEFELLQARASKNQNFTVEKNADWLTWRYMDRPGRPYTSFSYRIDGALVGYIVLKQWQELGGYKKAHIMDFCATNDEVANELLLAASDYSAECDELNLWCPQESAYYQAFVNAGFVINPEVSQPLIYKALKSEPSIELKNNWSFMYGDADGY